MKDRSKLIEEIRNIVNGKNKEKDPFSCGLEEFMHIIKNMDWNELRKLATSANISVNKKRREDLVDEINRAYVLKNKKGRKLP